MVIVRKSVAGLNEEALRRFVARTARATGLSGGVNVLVTTSRELRFLNCRFRGKDQPTDVLSFPAQRGLPGDLVGDIAISADLAAQNGKRLGHSAAEEVKVLVLHGVLHLAGYDHERDNGSMARKEMRLRTALGLPTGLIERIEKLQTTDREPLHDRTRGRTRQEMKHRIGRLGKQARSPHKHARRRAK